MKRDRQTERADQKKQEELERKRQQEFALRREEEHRKLVKQQKLALEGQEELRRRQEEQSRLRFAEYREQEKRAHEKEEQSREQYRAELLAQAKSEAITEQREMKRRDEQQQEHKRQVRTTGSELSPKRADERSSRVVGRRERLEASRREARVRASESESRPTTKRVQQPKEKPRQTKFSAVSRREREMGAPNKRERTEELQRKARVNPAEHSLTTERMRQPVARPEHRSSEVTGKRKRIEAPPKEARIRASESLPIAKRVQQPKEKPRQTGFSTVGRREREVELIGKHEQTERRRGEARTRATVDRPRVVKPMLQSPESPRQVSTSEVGKQRVRSTDERRRTEKHQTEAPVRLTTSLRTTEQGRRSQESRRLTGVSRQHEGQSLVIGKRGRIEEHRKEVRPRMVESRRAMKQIPGVPEKNRRAIAPERREPPQVVTGRPRPTEIRHNIERTRQSQENRRQAKRRDEQRLRSTQMVRQQQHDERNRLRQQQFSAPGPVSFKPSSSNIPVGNPSVSTAPVPVPSTLPFGTPAGDPPPQLTARIPSGNLSNGIVWLKASRNRIVSAETGRTVLLRGVNRSGLEYSEPILGSLSPFTHAAGITEADIQEIVTVWGANIIRLPFNQDWALNGRGGLSAEVYLEALDQVIYWASSYGAYTLLDLQWINSDQKNAPLPNRDSIIVWKNLAERYQFEPAVLYDIFTEPHDPLSGDGPLEGVDDNGRFFPLAPGTPVTMNEWQPWARQLIRAVRRIHTDALVFVSGINWAYDLRGMPLTIVPGGSRVFANLVYCTHVYPQKGPASLPQGEEPVLGRPRSPSWYQAFGFLTGLVPVFASEWGVEEGDEEAPDMLWADTLGQYLSSFRMGWTAWSWSDTPHLVRQYPSPYELIVRVPHEPTRYGDAVRDHLARP